ncbi:Alpha-glucosidase, partial [Stegodyphus mimosarum]
MSNLSRKLITGFLPNGIEVTYPDFFSDQITSWLQKNFRKLSRMFKFDGLFFQRNTPVNFSTSKETTCSGNNDMNESSYLLWNNLSIGTLNMAAMHSNNVPHLFLHNIYGYKNTLQVKSSLDNISHFVRRRKFLSSASTFIGSGTYSSSWGGLVSGSWKSLKQSIIQILDFSLFGMPLTGIPVCGTSGVIDIELCSRWLQYAAFQPLLLTHRIDGSELFLHNPRLASVARNMIGLRYSLLPYLYTLFYYSAK